MGPLILERRGAKAKAERLNVPTTATAKRAQRGAVAIHRRWGPGNLILYIRTMEGLRKAHLLRLKEGLVLSEGLVKIKRVGRSSRDL